MVTAKESQTCQQFAALNSPYLDHMAVLHNEQNCTLPSVVPTASISNVAFLGQQNSGLHVLDTLQMNGVGGFIPYPVLKPYPKVTQCVLPDGRGVPGMPMDTSCIPQKRFLIFDHSGNHTRMFVTASFSPQTPIAASNSPATHSGLHLDQQFLTKELVNENWDENHVTEREDDLLEDSEEIDALFYSDTEDDYDEGSDADGENDEVTSIMAHTPLSIENSFDKAKLLEEHTDEVASSDGTQKRRKLFDGRYKKPSLLNTKSPVERASLCTYEDDVESSCSGARKVYNDISSGKREKKVKVRDALKILEGIIPGLSSNDPLHIIEESIVFLKAMRIEAEALGLGYLAERHQIHSCLPPKGTKNL